MINEIYKVSIIIPVYNVEKYIKKCLYSILNQTYKNLEIILIDDGSTDNSGKICDKYKERDSRCKVYHKKNGGLPDARNYGLNKITGDLIMFVDSDDWLDLNCIELCINEFYQNEKIECVVFPYIREYKNKSKVTFILGDKEKILQQEEIQYLIHERLFGPSKKDLKKPDSMNDLNTAWGKIYYTRFLNDIKFLDVKYIGSAEDCCFNMNLFGKFSCIKYIIKTQYHYNKQNQTSIVHIYNKNLEQTKKNMYIYAKGLIKRNNLSINYEKRLQNRIVLDILDLSRNVVNSNISFLSKYRNIYRILNDSCRIDLLKKFSLSNLNFKWKVYYFFAKKNCVLGVIIMTRLAEMLKKYLR